MERADSSGTETARGVRFVAVVDSTPPGAMKRKQVKKTFHTLDDARQLVEEVRAEVAERGRLAARELTVEKALDDWLKTHESAKLESPSTANLYQSQCQPVMSSLWREAGARFESRQVEQLITSMLTGGKRNGEAFGMWAIRAAVGRLSQALDRAVRDKDVTENVATQVGNSQMISAAAVNV